MIKAIGGYMQVDSEGYLVNTCTVEELPSHWIEVVDEVLAIYQEVFGDELVSFYLRGSSAKSIVVDGVSDVDCVAIVNKKEPKYLEQLQIRLREVEKRYAFVAEIERNVIQRGKLSESLLFLLKTQALRLYGEDMTTSIRSYRVGPDCVVHLPRIQDQMRRVIDTIADETQERRVIVTRWVMKRVLRGMCELVMSKTGKYTRDLYYCREAFLEIYPEQEKLTLGILELAVHPTDDAEQVKKILREVLALQIF